MASTIISRTFSAVQDNRAVLNNSNFVRPFNAGNWNKLRVCVRVSARDTIAGGFPFIAPINFAVGLCSGSALPFNSASCKQFIGGVTNEPSPLPYAVFRTGPGTGCRYEINQRLYIAKKIGSVLTGGNETPPAAANIYFQTFSMGQVDYVGAPASHEGPRRSAVFVDITRPSSSTSPTSGNYLISLLNWNSSPASGDVSVAQFQAAAIVPTLVTGVTLAGHGFYNPGVGVIGDEITLGALDHICIAWNNGQNPIEISDVGFVKIL